MGSLPSHFHSRGPLENADVKCHSGPDFGQGGHRCCRPWVAAGCKVAGEEQGKLTSLSAQWGSSVASVHCPSSCLLQPHSWWGASPLQTLLCPVCTCGYLIGKYHFSWVKPSKGRPHPSGAGSRSASLQKDFRGLCPHLTLAA